MRLLTHNALRNNAADAKGKGYPLRITATEIRVDDSNDDNEEEKRQQILFVQNTLTMLDWPALVQAASEMGLQGFSLMPVLDETMKQDETFLCALYRVLMNVHLVRGILTCPITGREFPVQDGIPNMMIANERES